MIGYVIDRILGWAINRRRSIYCFWDGRRRRWADPLLISRRLLALDYFDPTDTPRLALTGDDESMADCARAVREAFDIPQLSDTGRRPTGLSEAELIRLLDQFYQWMDAQKKSFRQTQTSPPPTDQPFSADESTVQMSGSDSGSMDDGNLSASNPELSAPSNVP